MPSIFLDKEEETWSPIVVYSVVLLKSADLLAGQAYSLNLAVRKQWIQSFKKHFLRLLGIFGRKLG